MRVTPKVARSMVRAGADLDVVADLDMAELRHLDVLAAAGAIAEAVGADHRVGVDDGPLADDRAVVEHGVGIDGHVVAESAKATDHGPFMDAAAGTEDAAFADDRQRVDAAVATELGRGMDAGPRIDTVDGPFGSAVQVLDDGDERAQRILDLDQGSAIDGKRRRHHHRRRLALLQLFLVALVEKGDVAGVRLGKDPRGLDRHVAVPDHVTLDQLRQLADGDWHGCVLSSMKRVAPGGNHNVKAAKRAIGSCLDCLPGLPGLPGHFCKMSLLRRVMRRR